MTLPPTPPATTTSAPSTEAPTTSSGSSMFSSLLLASLPGLLLASSAPPAVPGTCPGCPADTDVNEEIVNFVYSELSLGDCQKEAIRVENFQSQVVAGIRYKFDLVATPGG